MTSTSRWTLSLTLLTASLAFAGWTQQGEATATVDAKGPAGFKIHGVAKKVTVTDDGKALTVKLAVADVDTDSGLRNGHMREDMEAAKYPDITLTVPLANLKAEEGKTTEAEAKGTFGLHGQQKEGTFTYKANCQKGVCEVEGSANLNLKDFGVKIRSYMGITVKPDIVVGAKFTVKK